MRCCHMGWYLQSSDQESLVAELWLRVADCNRKFFQAALQSLAKPASPQQEDLSRFSTRVLSVERWLLR
jgi:hypothetical protein